MSKLLDKAVISALRRLESEGRLDKYKVEEEARKNPNSPLRRFFTWDDATAAYERRLDQASELIRMVGFKIKDSTERFVVVPQYVRDPTKGPNEAGHINVEAAVEDRDLAEGVIKDALRQAEELLVRHRLLTRVLNIEGEFADIFRAFAVAREAAERVAKAAARKRKRKGEDRPTP